MSLSILLHGPQVGSVCGNGMTGMSLQGCCSHSHHCWGCIRDVVLRLCLSCRVGGLKMGLNPVSEEGKGASGWQRLNLCKTDGNVKCLLSVNTAVAVPKHGGHPPPHRLVGEGAVSEKGEELLLPASIVPGVSGTIPKNICLVGRTSWFLRQGVVSTFELYLTLLTQGARIWVHLETQTKIYKRAARNLGPILKATCSSLPCL